MIFHASMPTNNPRHVAKVLAELWGGYSAPFPAFPDSFMAVADDARGTVIETYPRHLALNPGSDESSYTAAPSQARGYSGFHLAIATHLDADDVLAIGQREGWRAVRCVRGQDFFEVIELWVENDTMIEVLTAQMQADYVRFTTSPEFRAFALAA